MDVSLEAIRLRFLFLACIHLLELNSKAKMRRVAVIGGGISGLGAAYELAKAGVHVVLYEKEDCLGGHAKTINVDGFDLDLGFMVFNRVTFPHMTEHFDGLGIDTEASDVSFSVTLDKGMGLEWRTLDGLRSLFAQKSNLVNPSFWKMLGELKKLRDDAIMYLEEHENNLDLDSTESLGHFIKSRGYSEYFQKAYLVPICASIWSCSPDRALDLSAFSVLSFCRCYHLLQLSGRPQWHAVTGRSHHYVKKLREELEVRGCHIKTSCEVHSVSTSDSGCILSYGNGSQAAYDGCIMAVPAPDAIKMLREEATHEEMRILGGLKYINSDIILHHDKAFMPQNSAAWCAWNFLGSTNGEVFLTYWLNVLQNISQTSLPFLATMNPPYQPKNVLLKWSTWHLVPSLAAAKASLEFDGIQGKRGIWFSEAYHGNGSHEDGLKAGMITAQAVLGRSFNFLKNPKQMVPSWTEAAARQYVIRFFKRFISAGCLILLEEGGAALTFEGSEKRCTWKSTLRVHNPIFYWKIAAEADLGFADAFVSGDVSVVDKNEGLKNFFMVILANLYLYLPASEIEKRRSRGWWTPILSTAAIASAKYFYQHVSRRNSITLARQNIAHHYDLSNEMFSLFMDETMTYTCGIFKSKDEDLKTAQLRKIHLLIEKARLEKHHELLDIGCGWGWFGIEAVKKTGCRYTGITLSEEQLKFAEQRAKEAGLQDRIRFLLCDYRELPSTHKYDRIIAIEMIEHVGHEYYEDFFRKCESVLADDGVVVIQGYECLYLDLPKDMLASPFYDIIMEYHNSICLAERFSLGSSLFALVVISIPDQRYDEHIRSSDFMREYLFPGACLPSISRLTSAMAAASRLFVEHVENVGEHYIQTIRCWRENLLKNQSKIRALGFDEKFLRVWEYYFDYCAAGYMARIIADYQIILSRQGNLTAFRFPNASIPSAHSYV